MSLISLYYSLMEMLLLERRVQIEILSVSTCWFDSTFQELLEDENYIVIQQHARTFILRMIGGFLM
ncbi:hypothetical protein Lal_00041088 [Lupinus albus]|nr:hypothetical protein Lal_00041088 [Lupinus albus]